MISGVLHCHDHLLLHLDVKPANIIVDTRGKSCKLSDFGCSRIASSFENGILIASEKTTYPNFGTIAYVAPELFKVPCLLRYDEFSLRNWDHPADLNRPTSRILIEVRNYCLKIADVHLLLLLLL